MTTIEHQSQLANQERERDVLSRMLKNIQALEQLGQTTLPADQITTKPDSSTKYLFKLPGYIGSSIPSNALTLEVWQLEPKGRFERAATGYFIVRHESAAQPNSSGGTDKIEVTSTFKMVVKPRLLRPTIITVEEARQYEENKDAQFRKLTRKSAAMGLEEQLGQPIPDNQVEEVEKHFIWETVADQAAFVERLVQLPANSE